MEMDDEQNTIDEIVEDVHNAGNKFCCLSTKELMAMCFVELEDSTHIVAQSVSVTASIEKEEALEYLDGLIEEERVETLQSGADLTPEEWEKAKRAYCESKMGSGSFHLTHYYKVEDSNERAIFFSSTHGDGGYCFAVEGPFKTLDLPDPWDGETLSDVLVI